MMEAGRPLSPRFQALIDPDLLDVLIPLRCLMDSHRQELLDNSSDCLQLFAGDRVFEAGQYDRYHYYLLSGELLLESPDQPPQRLRAGDTLAPIAPVQPRTCSATACEDVTLLKVDCQRLEQLLSWSQAAEFLLVDLSSQRDRDEDAAWLDTVLRSNLFLKVPPTNVGRILHQLQPRTVEAGEVILRQGELGDGCYFIKEGEAEVTRAEPAGDASRHLAYIGAGRCFGEDALIQETVRNATVTMRTDGVLLRLDKQAFLPLLKEPAVPQAPASLQGLTTDCILLDARTEPEYNLGHLPQAVNLPLHLLHLKHRLLASDRSYLVYCNSGARAHSATHFLSQLGYRAEAMSGGLEALLAAEPQTHLTSDDYLLRQGQVMRGH